jgi:cell wall-associated NlpC family hydrolase
LLCNIAFTAQTKSDSLIEFAKHQLGVNYKYGGINPNIGFDCSGFVKYVFSHFNIDVPRSSMDYEKIGRIIPLDSVNKGDIIVFTGTNAKIRKPGHVGIIVKIENNELYFIHASSGSKVRKVIITNYSTSASYQKRFIKAVRISELLSP